MLRAEVGGELLRSFANDFKAAYESALKSLVCAELV